ncbi:MAG: hypothetical protein ABIP29_09105 [Candidatus Eisenbacteria bacterium]
MSPIRSPRSLRASLPRVARRLLALALVPACLAGALAGCGGGAVDTAPSAAPPPAPAPPRAAEAEQLSSGWKYRFDMISPANANQAITTREMYLYFRPDTTAVHFQIENRLGVPIDILWDESTFLDVYGRSHKAVHRGVTYATRDLAQEVTHVQPGQRYSDFVIPLDLLNDPRAAAGQGGRLLMPTDLSAQSLLGRIFGPTLVVLGENGERRTFEVRFKVASVYADR